MIDVEREIREAFTRHDAETPPFDPIDTPVIVRRTRTRQVVNAVAVTAIGVVIVLAAIGGANAILRSDGIPADEHPTPSTTAGPTGPSAATGGVGGGFGAKGLDVVSLDPATGEVALLFDAPTNVEDPDVAPDGTTLIYTRKGGGSGYQVFSVGGDGVERQLTTSGGSAPVWSPDGSTIAFQAPGPGGTEDIYVMNADGTDTRLIADTGGNDVNPDWSPTGEAIAFLSGTGDGADAGIYTVSLADGSLTQVTSAADGDGERSPAWSPTGEWIAFVRLEDAPGGNLEADDSDVWLVHPDGSDAHRLLDEETQLDPNAPDAGEASGAGTADGHYQDDPEWSPDGGRLAWADVHAGVTVVDVATQETSILSTETWWDLSWDEHGLVAVES